MYHKIWFIKHLTGLYYCSQHNEDRSDHVSLAWDVTARDAMDERSGYDITMRHPAGSNIWI